MRCIQADQCYGDRFERVQKEMAAGDAVRYREIVRLYQAMVAALKSRDLSRFIPEQ